MQYMKLSTSRDFRINASTLESALQEKNTEDAENEPDNDQVRTLTRASARAHGGHSLWDPAEAELSVCVCEISVKWACPSSIFKGESLIYYLPI